MFVVVIFWSCSNVKICWCKYFRSCSNQNLVILIWSSELLSKVTIKQYFNKKYTIYILKFAVFSKLKIKSLNWIKTFTGWISRCDHLCTGRKGCNSACRILQSILKLSSWPEYYYESQRIWHCRLSKTGICYPPAIFSCTVPIQQQYQPFPVWGYVVVGLVSGQEELVWVQVL